MTEPCEITAGTSLAWTRPYGDHAPADGWLLSYSVRGGGVVLDVAATDTGTEWRLELSQAATTTIGAGRRTLAGYAARTVPSAERVEVYRAPLFVYPDLAAEGPGFDSRSHARRVLEAIEAVLEKRATKDQAAYSIAGRSLSRTPIPELLALRDRYRAEVAQEDAADRLAAGLGSRRTVRVRFGRP